MRVSLFETSVNAPDALEEGDAECVHDAHGVGQGPGEGKRKG